MKTSSWIWLSGLFFTGGAIYLNQPVIASVLFSLHVIIFFLHALEMKLNKLLNDRGLHLSRDELD